MEFATFFGVVRVIALSALLVVLLGLVGIYAYFRWKYCYWKKQNIKTTRPVFPLGDVYKIGFSKHVGVAFKEIYDQFKGERYNGMWVVHRPFIMIRDPDLIKNMFTRDFSYFRDRGFYVNEATDPLSANLFSLGGAKWRNLRTKISPTFSSCKMRKMFEVMAEKGEQLREILRQPADSAEEIGMKEYTVRYTHEVVASCILGFQADSIKNPRSVLRRLGCKIFDPSWPTIIKAALSFLVSDLGALFRIVAIPKAVTDFFLKEVHNVMMHREANGIKDSDFLQVLLELKNQGYLEDVDHNGNEKTKQNQMCKFTFKNAAAQAFIFWMAGFESSATTMQFALYEMSKQPAIQDRVRKEIRRVMEKYDGDITYDGLMEMEYLGRVVHEALRKYPPVTILNRVCTKRYKIPDSDVVIEEGTPVLIPVLGIHMDPEYFPDPEKFDPERFTEMQKAMRHHYTYLPFGEGPHTCIGQRFALMQIKVGLVKLLSSYKFEVTENTPKKPRCGRKLIIYTVRDGIPLKITRLEK